MASRKSASGASQRQLRVGEELRHIVAGIFQADRLHDPDLAGKSITVTEVRVSPDLRNATVFVMPLGGESIGSENGGPENGGPENNGPENDGSKNSGPDANAPIFDALKRAAPHITALAASQLRTRRAPRLTFERDGSFDQAKSIEALLRRPNVAKDLSE